jgi:hypothetical protein
MRLAETELVPQAAVILPGVYGPMPRCVLMWRSREVDAVEAVFFAFFSFLYLFSL